MCVCVGVCVGSYGEGSFLEPVKTSCGNGDKIF